MGISAFTGRHLWNDTFEYVAATHLDLSPRMFISDLEFVKVAMIKRTMT